MKYIYRNIVSQYQVYTIYLYNRGASLFPSGIVKLKLFMDNKAVLIDTFPMFSIVLTCLIYTTPLYFRFSTLMAPAPLSIIGCIFASVILPGCYRDHHRCFLFGSFNECHMIFWLFQGSPLGITSLLDSSDISSGVAKAVWEYHTQEAKPSS